MSGLKNIFRRFLFFLISFLLLGIGIVSMGIGVGFVYYASTLFDAILGIALILCGIPIGLFLSGWFMALLTIPWSPD